jgi:hypothetical protein
MNEKQCVVCQTRSTEVTYIEDKRLGCKHYECENCNKLNHFEKELLQVLWSINNELWSIANR